jgi:hypothetical protein
VAILEVGDKTQLLALLLAPHFREPLPTALRIFVATGLNHTAAALLLDTRLRRAVQRQHAVGATRNGLFFGDRHRDAGDLDVDRAEMVAAGASTHQANQARASS